MTPKFKAFQYPNGKITQSAYVHGYYFGDRMLEGVFFKISVAKDGTLTAETPEQYKYYVSTLNEAKWLQEAVDFATDHDAFYPDEEGDEEEELVLIPIK